jgi:hypothetical protein
MATRFYLSSSDAAAGFGYDSAWEDTSFSESRTCFTTKQGSPFIFVSVDDSNNQNRDVAFRQYVSLPLSAQTLGAQTVKLQIRGYERLPESDYKTNCRKSLHSGV